jgi:hypothetical protein
VPSGEEEKLLLPCREWLAGFLRQKYRGATITILEDTDRRQLRYPLNDAGLAERFPECSAWEVKVDVVATFQRRKSTNLVFVELKARPISLVDVGQLLGYCRVCHPSSAYLLSSAGISSQLERLLTTYGRTDVLDFGNDVIRVGAWDVGKGEPDWSSMIPSGDLGILVP